MKNRKLRIAGVVVLLLVPAYWWLLMESGQPTGSFPLDISELRRLADSMPGEKPGVIRVEDVLELEFPTNAVLAGSGWSTAKLPIFSYQLVFPDRTLIVDTAMDHVIGKDASRFDDEAFARVMAAMEKASLVIVTHEHLDHLDALVSHGGAALYQTAWLNAAQLPPSPWAAKLVWPGGVLPPPRIIGTAPQAVAPGIVVIPAPDSHTPGSQMIFVRLADGRELLFTGDISSFGQNWQEQRGRSRLIETWFAPENRDEVFDWLKTIEAWHTQAPGLLIVPGHDYEWLENPEHHLGAKFAFAPAAPR